MKGTVASVLSTLHLSLSLKSLGEKPPAMSWGHSAALWRSLEKRKLQPGVTWVNLLGSRSSSASQGLSATSWDLLSQKPLAKPLPDFWPPETEIMNVCCFKLWNIGGNFLSLPNWVITQVTEVTELTLPQYSVCYNEVFTRLCFRV